MIVRTTPCLLLCLLLPLTASAEADAEPGPGTLEADLTVPLFEASPAEDDAWLALDPAPADWLSAWTAAVEARWLPLARALELETVGPVLDVWEQELGYGIDRLNARLLDRVLGVPLPVRKAGGDGGRWALELDADGPDRYFLTLHHGVGANHEQVESRRLAPADLAPVALTYLSAWGVIPTWERPLPLVSYEDAGLDTVIRELCTIADLDLALRVDWQGGAAPMVSLGLRGISPIQAIGLACEMAGWRWDLSDYTREEGDNGFDLFGPDPDEDGVGPTDRLLQAAMAASAAGRPDGPPEVWHRLLRADIERMIARHKRRRFVLSAYPQRPVAEEGEGSGAE